MVTGENCVVRTEIKSWSTSGQSDDSMPVRMVDEIASITQASRESKGQDRIGAVRGFDGAAIDLWRHVFEFAFPAIIAGGTYAGKKVIDVVATIVEKRLSLRTDEHASKSGIHAVIIYGPTGEVVKVVQQDSRHARYFK